VGFRLNLGETRAIGTIFGATVLARDGDLENTERIREQALEQQLKAVRALIQINRLTEVEPNSTAGGASLSVMPSSLAM
jgi:hypothetical protein